MFEQVAGYLGGVAVGWVLIFDLGFRGLGMGRSWGEIGGDITLQRCVG